MKRPEINRSKSKQKMKRRLPKSASSNPSSNKFREAAKAKAKFGSSMFFKSSKSDSQESGGLTLEALEKHNVALGGFSDLSADDHHLFETATTVGNKTVNTWATNMTGCTNVTFNRVHRYINSSSAIQKEILAVLAAVTEVIKEKGGDGNNVQYFGILVSSLQEAEKPETMTAMAHLLSIVIKKVPVAVLQSQFSQVSKTLVDIITRCASGKDIFMPIKPVLSCMASLLRVIDATTWTESSTQHAYKAILLYIAHPKPKLRKAAQSAVRVVLLGSVIMQQSDSSSALPYHPAAPITAKWCISTLEAASGQSNRVDMLHTLALLKEIFPLFPHKHVKSGSEVILKLLTLADPMVRASCLEVLYRLFKANPKEQTLPADMNGQIVMALYDHQPSDKDVQPMIAWLRVVEAAVINIARYDASLYLGHLPRLFSTCMASLLSDRHNVAKAAVDSMKTLLEKCADVLSEKSASGEGSSDPSLTALQKVVKSLETGLSYQFHSMWALVFQLWTTAFKVIGKIAPKMLMKCLSSMGDLRDTPHFSFKAELEQAVGGAVMTMGPRRVLEAIPLGISGDHFDNLDFPRSWLLPVIRDNVTHTELGFFTSFFLPLAAAFTKKAEECQREQRVTESKAYDVLQLQIWSMLKGFCDHPCDLKQSFQGIAKILGTALNERDDLRMDVMSALRSVISCSMDNEEDKQEVARFAKNYVPILFNLFTSEGLLNEGTRLAVLETIKKYFTVADPKLIKTFQEKCLSKMGETEIGAFRNIALLDLCIAMIPYTDLSGLQKMLQQALSRLESEDRTVQKKSYRVLEEICSGSTASSQKLLSSKLDLISETLLKSLSKSSPSSKAPRLRCLISIFKNLEEENMEFFMATLPETILCTKEIGIRARAASYELITVMVDVFVKWNSSQSEKESVGEFVTKVLAGLAGSPHMISATMLALTRIVYTYKDHLSGPILDNMVENVCLLLTTKTREIIKTSLGFVKVLLSAFENTTLASHLKDLLDGLHDITVKGNVRRLTKIIYQKLIKKFGYELILNMTKEDVHKLLKNIHKSQERSKRKKEEEGEDSEEESDEENKPSAQPDSLEDILRDTDSELEDDEDDRNIKKNKKFQRKRENKAAWLMEGGDDEIVDFMDPSIVKQVVTTKPNQESKKASKDSKDRGFKMSADGRIIITQDEDEIAATKGDAMGSDAEQDLDDLFTALEGGIKSKARKRKFKADDEADEDDIAPSSSKYKAGGSGIHRPIATAKKRKTEEISVGKEYRSKKASGDMKKKDRPDPYAYVPLNIASLNKRKQVKMQGAFKNLVKGAKRGAAKGSKGKGKTSNKGKAHRK